MNRFKIRAAVVGLAAVFATLLSGCGAGQISQTAAQEPAVNGSRFSVGNVALRDVRIQAEQNKKDFLQPGQSVDLVAVVVNQSPDQPDKLVSIDTEVGKVTLSGDTRVLPSRLLFLGVPEGQRVGPGPTDGNSAARATLQLKQPITNGINYKFTFNFEKAGPATFDVPISAPIKKPSEG
ncbi:hypothetical protein BST27_12155 [Mycobacterium intermedium]|uniref:Lipoprotein LpqE n=1 Tax=Mycobacterium intermedium TaxID=28445 RepID=A0A1E3SEK8_MYCIE|nr:hypothetical protein [Mycobacterium intermedium]MCV6965506.1 hypothetical protein [Mycobacterium intermedium]ODR00571.1 hypothetical protein BHQ20_12450 [Mycobacterium intermedium]OPE48059.1 hypothetical protein BV508_19620 [Mycobacterium intermedium]ORB05719.1 hypothetical protein BST27_12155 [Mycobacterium intermedium]